jgi:hypothetical protein
VDDRERERILEQIERLHRDERDEMDDAYLAVTTLNRAERRDRAFAELAERTRVAIDDLDNAYLWHCLWQAWRPGGGWWSIVARLKVLNEVRHRMRVVRHLLRELGQCRPRLNRRSVTRRDPAHPRNQLRPARPPGQLVAASPHRPMAPPASMAAPRSAAVLVIAA